MKVEVGFVTYHYHYVKVEVPEDYPEDIDEWNIDQISAMQQKARDKLPRGERWDIDDDFEMELSN